MGKRYGRNQKRRHREQIAKLETQVDNMTELSAELGNTIGKWRGLYKDLVSNIEHHCQNHAVLEPKVVMKSHWFYDERRVAEWDKYEPIPLAEMAMNQAVQMEVHQTLLHIIDILTRYEDWDDSIHVILRGPNEKEQVCYAVSGKEIDYLHLNKGFIKFVREEVTRSLIKGVEMRNAKKLR